MEKYSEMSREQLLTLKKELENQYADIKAQDLFWICPAVNREQNSLTSPWA